MQARWSAPASLGNLRIVPQDNGIDDLWALKAILDGSHPDALQAAA